MTSTSSSQLEQGYSFDEKTGSTKLVVEGEHSDTMVEQAEHQRTISDYAKLTLNSSQSSIVRPPVPANNFELKPAFVQMVQQPVQFHGSPDEDPNSHIGGLLEVCDMLKMNGVLEVAIKLRLFPFSLKGKVKRRLQALPRASITTREQLLEAFLA